MRHAVYAYGVDDQYYDHHYDDYADGFYHCDQPIVFAGYATSLSHGQLDYSFCQSNTPAIHGVYARYAGSYTATPETTSTPETTAAPETTPTPETTVAATPQYSLAAELGGWALALGTGTVTNASIVNTIEDMGNYTIAFGDAAFTAAAHSTDGGDASAQADTYLSVTGADFLFQYNHDLSNESEHNPWAQSETQYIAIDIHDWTPTGGPVVLESHNPLLFPPDPAGPYASTSIAGNLANVFSAADAFGAGALSATSTHALTIENQFSMVSGAAFVAA